MVDPHDLAEDKQALCEFASTRYAESEGYPIPQWRRGIRWFIGDSYHEPDRGDPPWMFWCPRWCERTPNDTYIVADEGQVVEIGRDYDILWSYGSYGQGASDKLSEEVKSVQLIKDYPSSGQDSVLISDSGNGRVLLIDYEDKSVLTELTSIDSGSLSTPFCRFIQRSRWANIKPWLICDLDNHYAAAIDRDGAESYSFGVWGSPGSDDTHLDTPQAVAPNERVTPSGMVIADTGNERVLHINAAGAIQTNLIVPQVQSVHNILEGHESNVAFSSWQHTGLVEIGDGCPHYRVPLGSRFATLTRDPSVIYRRHAMIIEDSVRPGIGRPASKPSEPRVFKRMDSVSLDANASGDYYPFWPMVRESCTIKALTTQDADLEIYSLQTAQLGIGSGRTLVADSTPATWNEYDTVSLTADTPQFYKINEGLGVMAARITMGGTAGNANLWVMYGLGA